MLKILDKKFKIVFRGDKSLEFKANKPIELDKGLVLVEAGNGAGKSSLLSVLALVNSPDIEKDTIFFNDKDYYDLYSNRLFQDQKNIRSNEFVIITQEPYFLPFSLKENLRLLNYTESEMDSLIDEMQKKFKTINYDSMESELSGGQKQRFFIEMMFNRIKKNQKKVIFIDEPFNNLSGENKVILLEKINKFSQSNLVFVVEHDITNNYEDHHIDYEKLYKIKVNEGETTSSRTVKNVDSIEIKLIKVKDSQLKSFIDSLIRLAR
ncbi:MAG: hypothetical protein CR982_10155 [Candidatus Cloacimonadota bacterium]|nr:MAG: hypothetical protein CR982_10155 [Candidatus Cloacimonadota bacterium]PIE78518.1 MAG: hypothetical protein CSA15_07435 [Candidatus Delongbacteria bacterium]